MLGQSISLALLTSLGLVSSLPTEKRQELAEGTLIQKRSVAARADIVFEECSTIDIGGVETAFDILVETYGSSPDTVTFFAMQPLYNILRGCGVSLARKRDAVALVVPADSSPVDTTGLQEVYAQLEAASPQPASLHELIAMDAILSTIEMNGGGAEKRWADKRSKGISCSTERVNAWRLGLFTIASSYGDEVPITIWLIAENLIALLNSCGVGLSMEDVFGLGTPVTGGLEPDPTVPGGPIIPDNPVDGGELTPDNPANGGEITPDNPTEGGEITPDNPVTVTLSPGSVPTAAAAAEKSKRGEGFHVYPGHTTGMVPDKPVPGGAMIPDPVVPGGALNPDSIHRPPRSAKRQFSIGEPVTGGGLVPSFPGGSPPPGFTWPPPRGGGMIPPDSSPHHHHRRDLRCNQPIHDAMVTLEKTYGRACDGKLQPSILMAQQALVMIIFRECGDVWPEWQLVELNGGFIEIGPIYSTGPYPSD